MIHRSSLRSLAAFVLVIAMTVMASLLVHPAQAATHDNSAAATSQLDHAPPVVAVAVTNQSFEFSHQADNSIAAPNQNAFDSGTVTRRGEARAGPKRSAVATNTDGQNRAEPQPVLRT